MNQTMMALLWGALGTMLFTIIFASSKLTGGEISVFQIMFIRYVSGLLSLLFVTSFLKTALTSYKSTRPLFHFCRSISGSMGGLCIIQASYLSPIADVTALSLTDGLLTVLLSVWFLGEVVGKTQWFGGFLCGAGAFIIVYGASNGIIFAELSGGLWLALLGALLISIEAILIKVLTSNERAMTILLHVNFFSILILLVPAFYFWHMPNVMQLMFFVSLGPIAVFAQYCWIKAYSMEDVSIVTPINYTWILFAAVLGYFFFNEKISQYTLVGSVFITLGSIVLAKYSKPKEVQVKYSTERPN